MGVPGFWAYLDALDGPASSARGGEVSDDTLDHLLDALTTAAETGRGYTAARAAVVEHVERLHTYIVVLRGAIESVSEETGRLL